MSLVEKFDLAIKNANIKNLDCAGYLIEGRTYSVYQDNESWNKFKNEMKELFPDAYEEYGAGGGSEMEEKDNKPPKMASFASSSSASPFGRSFNALILSLENRSASEEDSVDRESSFFSI